MQDANNGKTEQRKYMGTLYFLISFFVKLICSKKISLLIKSKRLQDHQENTHSKKY